jgi:demethylmenaquinone methyltransferase/2-methoxy-6-polyprenyl-1,4-benzoquinol methylase
VAAPPSERNRLARELFAPLAPTYDRYASLLSFGQDPRWRSFLASRIDATTGDTVLDVASGTAAVAIEVARQCGCSVVALDQSPEMLAEGRRRVEAAGLAERIQLQEGRAEDLPFEAASFAGLTFTYLLRYVDDPAATMRELARVVRPGGRIAMLEFSVPARALPRAAWEAYVQAGLPLAGRVVSPGWAEVGAFLGPSIRDFWRRWPPDRLRGVWEGAGVGNVEARLLSLGGGIVMWGTRAG